MPGSSTHTQQLETQTMNNTDIEISLADWSQDQDALKQIRTEVFINEQNVPVELEWDDEDRFCTHFIVRRHGQAIATARMQVNGHIGRMAVLKSERGRGVGSQLLEAIIDHARNAGLITVFLNAQIEAVRFYENHGFVAYGKDFLDAGIQHRAMHMKI